MGSVKSRSHHFEEKRMKIIDYNYTRFWGPDKFLNLNILLLSFFHIYYNHIQTQKQLDMMVVGIHKQQPSHNHSLFVVNQT